MLRNKLGLNVAKTEFFLNSFPDNSILSLALSWRSADLRLILLVPLWNLGLTYNPHMKINFQVNSICRNVNFQFRNIACSRHFIYQDTCAHAATSLTLSRPNHGNSSLVEFHPLALNATEAPNHAVRLIYRVNRRASAAPLLRELHWLPVQQRTNFKILLHVYNCLNSLLGPSYLSIAVFY